MRIGGPVSTEVSKASSLPTTYNWTSNPLEQNAERKQRTLMQLDERYFRLGLWRKLLVSDFK